MNLSDYGAMLSDCSNKENVKPASPNGLNELPSSRMPSQSQNILQTAQFILDAIIKFETHTQYVDHSKFWEIDGDTFVIEHDDFNTFIAKCTLHQAIILTPIQIPIILIRVSSTKEQVKLLFRIATFAAKLEDLSTCIFHVQITPDSTPVSSISSLPTQQELLTLLLINAPMLPKSVIKQMRDLLMHIEAIAPST